MEIGDFEIYLDEIGQYKWGIKMNRETLKYLEEREEQRVRGIAKLASLWNMDFREVEKLVDKMNIQLENPDRIQRAFEAAMDAEFNF